MGWFADDRPGGFLVTPRRMAMLTLVLAAATAAGCAKRVVRGDVAGDPAPARPPAAAPASRPDPVRSLDLGVKAASLASDQVGRPYRWGGEEPDDGFDCSGLVFWTYGNLGVDLPRVVRQQKETGRSVGGGDLRPGDLVFFAIDKRRTSHVGLYLGDSRFVHAPSSGSPVRVDSLDDPWWRERWTVSRRVAGG